MAVRRHERAKAKANGGEGEVVTKSLDVTTAPTGTAADLWRHAKSISPSKPYAAVSAFFKTNGQQTLRPLSQRHLATRNHRRGCR